MTLSIGVSNDTVAEIEAIAKRNDVKRIEVLRAMVINFSSLPENDQDAIVFDAIKKIRVMALEMRKAALVAEMEKIRVEMEIYDKEIKNNK